MGRGGKRENAGRKPSVVTVTLRVPKGGSAVARGLVEFAIRRAQEEIVETQWYKTSPAKNSTVPPEVRIVAIEDREVLKESGIAGLTGRVRKMEPHLICETTVAGLKARFSVLLEAGRIGCWFETETQDGA